MWEAGQVGTWNQDFIQGYQGLTAAFEMLLETLASAEDVTDQVNDAFHPRCRSSYVWPGSSAHMSLKCGVIPRRTGLTCDGLRSVG